jgi:DNA end-binding protein Ku
MDPVTEDVPKASAREVSLAEQLIEGMVSRWDPKKYPDSYSDDLLAAIKQKDKKGYIEAKAAESPRTAKLADLTELLRQSVSLAKKGGGRPPKHRKRAA